MMSLRQAKLIEVSPTISAFGFCCAISVTKKPLQLEARKEAAKTVERYTLTWK